MTPQYVYVLATYGEYGLEERVATVDRVSVPVLLERFLAGGFMEKDRTNAMQGLADLLRQPDEGLSSGKHDLMPGGWGGVQLYVIKLE